MSPAVPITKSPGYGDFASKNGSGVFWFSFPTFDELGWDGSAEGERGFLAGFELVCDECILIALGASFVLILSKNSSLSPSFVL